MANTNTTYDIPTNVGIITVINTSRRNKPKGLKYPWDYILKINQVKAFVDEMDTFLRPYATINEPTEDQKVTYPEKPGNDQVYRSPWALTKPRVYAYATKKLHQGAAVFFSLESSSFYLTSAQWETICMGMQEIITKYLGSDAYCFSHDYFRYIREPEYYQEMKVQYPGRDLFPSGAEHRLYARFESNILFEDIIPIQESSKSLFKRD